MSKYRRIDAGVKYSPCFGMLCVSDELGMTSDELTDVDGSIKVGDAVEVVRRGEHFFFDESKQ